MSRSEDALVADWKAGDAGAVSTLIQRYRPDMLRFFLAVTGGDRAHAEDLVQETFVTVSLHRDDLSSSFRAYCYGVARLKRFEALRDRRARTLIDALDDTELVLELPASLPEEERERGKVAIEVLRRLECDDQLLLVLKDYLGFTQPELAETFKIPQSRVSGRINRARRRFRRQFEALEQQRDEWEPTLRSLASALASIVARLPAALVTPASAR